MYPYQSVSIYLNLFQSLLIGRKTARPPSFLNNHHDLTQSEWRSEYACWANPGTSYETNIQIYRLTHVKFECRISYYVLFC